MSKTATTQTMTVHDAGVLGSLKRWGPPRHLNIGDLNATRRKRVAVFIESERRAQEVETA